MIITFQISFIFTTAYSYHNFDLVLTPPEKFESTYQSPTILDLCFRKTRVGKSHNYRDVNVFERLHFQNCFPSTVNRQAGVSKFLRFEERFVTDKRERYV